MIIPDSELIPLLKAAIERGQRVKLTVNGRSMFPFIRDGDIVELAPAAETVVKPGSIVLAQLPDEHYPLHRIVSKLDDTSWLLRGDCRKDPDGPVTREDIIGIVTHIKRNGHRVRFALGYTGQMIGWLSGIGILFPVTMILFFPGNTLKSVVRKFCSKLR